MARIINSDETVDIVDGPTDR